MSAYTLKIIKQDRHTKTEITFNLDLIEYKVSVSNKIRRQVNLDIIKHEIPDEINEKIVGLLFEIENRINIARSPMIETLTKPPVNLRIHINERNTPLSTEA